MKHLFSFFFAAIIITGLLASSSKSHASTPDEVVVACEQDFKPYSFLDDYGRPAGFCVEIITAVAGAMDIPIRIVHGTWDSVWNGLVEGRYDVLPIVAKLPSRLPYVDFSLSHTETFDAFIVRSGDPLIKDVRGARGKEILVLRSDAAHHALLERNFEGKIIPVDKASEMVRLLASGKHDAILFPKLLGIMLVNDLGISGLKVGPTIPDHLRDFAFAVKKGDAELLEKLNQGLLIVKSNGEYDRIYEKWLGYADPWLKYKKYFWHIAAILAAAAIVTIISIFMLRRIVKERTAELAEKNQLLSHEIAERMRAEDELIKAQKLESLGVFAGGIAHDFNNLLQAITNSISVARMHAPPGSPVLRVLNDAENATKYAAGLSMRLLTFAKGGSPVRKVSLIENVLQESISLSMSGSNIACETVIGDGLPPVEIDEAQMNQVFSNLIINAKESMPDGGRIQVNAQWFTALENRQPRLKDGEYVRISITDNGAGIPEENLIKIFDPYFSTKERGAEKGTGLGLSVCHSIITKHDGLITVESQVGRGATFHVYLPVSDKPPYEVLKKEIAPRVCSGRILMMEDEKNLWVSTRLIFKSMGYEVEFAMNGNEAISIYRRAREAGRPFDGVILDLTIPGGMGGKETIKMLQETDGGVKAIVVSGYADDPVMTNFREYGFVAALAKPYTVEQLRETVISEFGPEGVLTRA